MFKNRKEAGQLLAERLVDFKGKKHTLVVGIPRGGVPVAFQLAKSLNLPLDIVVTRKLGAPGQKELAIGAIGPKGVSVFDEDLIERLKVEKEYQQSIIQKEKKEIKQRVRKFRGKKKESDFGGKTVILVDDGIATGSTVEAAIKYLRKKGTKRVILAVPVAPLESVDKFKKIANEFVVIDTPKDFYAVGQFYKEFPQTSDEEVIKLLQNA